VHSTTRQSATRVDFYILEAADPASRLHFACRLTEKAYGMSTGVYAHTGTPAEAQRLDELLWTFRQGSFIPHQLLTNIAEDAARLNAKAHTPISIGSGSASEHEGDLLINLTDELPEFATGFQRIAEIICGNEEAQQTGRKRYKQYKGMGLEPETHRIG
jgi:DNA polymerase-3 subunit chi